MLNADFNAAVQTDNAVKQASIIEEKNSPMRKMDLMVLAMWEILEEKGFTHEELVGKLEEVKERKETLDARENIVLCPKCRKKVKESYKTPFEGTCMYCGTKVAIYPGSNIEEEPEVEPEPDPLAGLEDDLIF